MTEHPISSANKAARACGPSQATSSPRILVVDDDGDIRRLNTEALRDSGYEVEAAADGIAAWHALNQDSYDLMITDNNMPKLTGIELLQKMRDAHMTLPVIIASGTFFPQKSSANNWRQPEAALLKPYTIEALLQTVKKILHEDDQPAVSAAGLIAQNPRAIETAPAVVLKPRLPQAAHRILVVDEDRDLRQMYSEVLAGPGYQVDGVADGAAGWESLQTNPYGLLITEHDLPGLTGVELIRKIRAAHMALPIVMAVGRLPITELAQTPSLQLAAILTKPFAMDVLLNTVKSALSSEPQFGRPKLAPHQ